MESEKYILEIKRLGERIRALRKDKNLTQLDLEATAGIDRADISRIENGQLDIKMSSLIRLAEALEVDLQELFASA